MFFAETEGELTLGSAAAFAADSVWRGNRAKQSNTPSVSPQKRRRSTFLREEDFKKKPLFIIDRVKAKSLFISFPTRRKSAFRSANNEMTGGSVSGGALKCGDCKAMFPPQGGNTFKLSILPRHADASAAALHSPQL